MHHPDNLSVRQIIYDGQHQEIVFYKQFQGPVQGVITSEGPDIRPHEVLGANQGLQSRLDEGLMDLLQIDHTEQPALSIHNRLGMVKSGSHSVNAPKMQ